MADHPHDPSRGHPIPAVITRMCEEATGIAEAPAWSLDLTQTRAALVDLTVHENQVAALKATLLTHLETLDNTGAAAWLATETRTTHRAARRQVNLAAALQHHDPTREAMAAGQVQPDQATVICSAIDALPDQSYLREQCEKHLVALAEHYDARDLKNHGRRVLEIVDPDAADAHEGALLDKEERDSAKATSFSMWETGDGKVRGRFTLPALEGGMLRKALMSIAAPKHQRATGEVYDHQRPTHTRLGRAFAEYVSRYPADKLPHAGGINATVVVTMTLDTLMGGLKTACVDTSGPLSAGAARRLACEAGIVPAVLDGKSRVLDLGHKRRFHDDAQRLALAVSQKHCQHPTCDAPAWLCHVHHTQPWSRGGTTNLENAQLLCPRHHTLAHREAPMRT